MEFDQQQALDEGWCVVERDSDGWLEIQRDDVWGGVERFVDDIEAGQYVVERADEGSQYHLSALRYITDANSTFEHAGPPIDGWIYMVLRTWDKGVVACKAIVRVRADYSLGDDPYASDAVPFAVGSNQDLVPLDELKDLDGNGETLVIDNVNLLMLERQRKSLQKLLGIIRGPFDAATMTTRVPGLTTEDVETLVGLENMLDHWSDKRAVAENADEPAELAPTKKLTVTENLRYVFEVPADMKLEDADEFFCNLDDPDERAESFDVVGRECEMDGGTLEAE